MRTIGIDLSAKGEHKAVIVDEVGRFVSPVIRFRTNPRSMARLLEVAQEGNPAEKLQAVMEPTGMAWFPVAIFLVRHSVTVYLVNSQQVADLRKYFKKHAKSDRIDARVLAKLPPRRLRETASPGALQCQDAGLPARLQTVGVLDETTHRLPESHHRIGSFCLAGSGTSGLCRPILFSRALVSRALVFSVARSPGGH